MSSLFATQAPGCFATLKRSIGASATEELASIYEVVARAGGLIEGAITRAPGVSFNPRPARLCQLVLQAGVREPSALKAALLSALSSESLQEIDSDESRIALRAQRAFANGETADSSSTIFAIVLALAIDEIRHLHMSGLAPREQTRLCERAERLLTSPQIARETLTPLLRTAVTQTRRRLAEQYS